MFKHRQGRFTIDHAFIDNNPKIVIKVMGKCIVVRAESMFCPRRIEYHALSPHFDEVPMGQVVPEYRVVIYGKDGELVKFERVDV